MANNLYSLSSTDGYDGTNGLVYFTSNGKKYQYSSCGKKIKAIVKNNIDKHNTLFKSLDDDLAANLLIININDIEDETGGDV